MVKKSRHFYYHAYFFIWKIWKDKKAPQNTYFLNSHFLYIQTPRWNLRSDRLEDVTHLSNTILLPIVVQVYEFHEFYEKSEKLKNKNFESPQRK